MVTIERSLRHQFVWIKGAATLQKIFGDLMGILVFHTIDDDDDDDDDDEDFDDANYHRHCYHYYYDIR